MDLNRYNYDKNMEIQNDYSLYYADVVMCIDGSARMSNVIDEIKLRVLSFGNEYIEAMSEVDNTVKELRIKVIVFREFGKEGKAIEESKFFTLPADDAEFTEFVRNIQAVGGGETSSNALEALALALKSDWTTKGHRRRYGIMMFSNGGIVPFGAYKDHPDYPQGMPKDFDSLYNWWEGWDNTFKGTYVPRFAKFTAFVPYMSPWTDMMIWNRYWPIFSENGVLVSNEIMQSAIDFFRGDI